MISMDQNAHYDNPFISSISPVGARHSISAAGIYIVGPNGARTGTFEHVLKTPAPINGLMQPFEHTCVLVKNWRLVNV